MTNRTLVTATTLIVSLAACAETQTVDPISQAVSGRTLVAGDTRLTAGANGALVGTLASGDTLSGTWRISNGKWCRTLTQPARFAGPEVCQDAALADGQLVIVGSSGAPTTYTIE
ncbi:hypothetical protein [Pacificoceanicola onchidii]|uniref:hypothetical protein n=1 Tax=Pacificoceanicola onchidii TaxID=2562685 RepID=UPI0010A2B74C|nr:hypothetical protein [Pacificoceanicola onchidii]